MADKGNIGKVQQFPKVYTASPNVATSNNKFGTTLTRVAANITGGSPSMPVSLSLNGFDVAVILRLSASGSITIYDLNDGTWYLTEQGNGTTLAANAWKIVVSGSTATVTRVSRYGVPVGFSYT